MSGSAERIPHEFRERLERLDPYLAPQAIVGATIGLDFSLPDKLVIGPIWLLPGLEALLLVGLIIASPHPRMRHNPLRRNIALALTGFVSAVNIVSLYLLVHFLLHHKTTAVSGPELIRSGVTLWITNVLLFGLWFWQLDRGGPLARATGEARCPTSCFPRWPIRDTRRRTGCPA